MRDNLYIIGNGFDLHHRLKTSYCNFRDDYARKNHTLWQLLCKIYGGEIKRDLWWSSFEETLGIIDYLNLMNSYNGEALAATTVNNLFRNLQLFFSEWIRKVDDKTEVDDLLKIDTNSQFFTFNYTLLLENSYNIDRRNIWHIHNSKMDFSHGNYPIVGHDDDNRAIMSNFASYREKHPEFKFGTMVDMINQETLKGAKKVKERIVQFSDRFSDQYASIKHFISMGFSFNEIDLPYIEKIIQVNNNPAEADWTLYWHSDGERERLEQVMKELGMDSGKVSYIKW